MLDIKFIRENPDLIKEAARKKHIDFDVEKLIAVDEKRRAVTTAVEKKRTEQNEYSTKIVKASNEEKVLLIKEMQTLKEGLQKEEEELKTVMKEWQMLMVQVPNVPDVSVPEGASDAENKESKLG